jgi:NADH-quinone oxidoreductase subunit C
MWGDTSPDVSGFGDLARQYGMPGAVVPPLEGWYGMVDQTISSQLPTAVVARFLDRDELTLWVRREELTALARLLRDDPYLRFEVCSSVSGVHYPGQAGAELHAVYHLLSVTHNRRLRLEVAVPEADAHVPSVTRVWPMADWHERETYDMFGIVFDGHPWLTRILMPDDWVGFPQRKDYPLGGIDVTFKGASTPPADERRSYAR